MTASTIREAQLEQALELALGILIKYEPGDSRAVSNEFVAMACILNDDPNQEALDIISKALEVKP